MNNTISTLYRQVNQPNNFQKQINDLMRENAKKLKPINDLMRENAKKLKPINDLMNENAKKLKPLNDLRTKITAKELQILNDFVFKK